MLVFCIPAVLLEQGNYLRLSKHYKEGAWKVEG